MRRLDPRQIAAAGFVVLILFGLINGPVLAADSFVRAYEKHCSVCHGKNMQGGLRGPALIGAPLTHGESVEDLARNIARGFPTTGMTGWSETLDEGRIRSLAILIAEKRLGLPNDSMMSATSTLPVLAVETELATFRVETVATGIDPFAYSIAPLPNGEILLTEKKRGLSIVYPDGTRSAPIEGTPPTSETGTVRWGLDYGIGWHLDVAPHPDYETNGWIYLHHTDLCSGCDKKKWFGFLEISMNRLVRGRIENGKWIDQQVVWSMPREFHNPNPDLGAGGRIAFDNAGFVYLSVGTKGGDFKGIQDLSKPYGKIHRIHEDGRIPDDNPFRPVSGALPSIWTYGHRVPQGLEFDRKTSSLWNSEMGPRGGDEINLLQPGKNYGWPVQSKGVNYDGTSVAYTKDLEPGFDIDDVEQPVVDLTPSPAVSSFIIYAGDAFPGWRGQFLVGSLKARTLYRIQIENNKHIRTEILLDNLARIRDVEMGPGGLVYLLLEHEDGSRIVRLVPAKAMHRK